MPTILNERGGGESPKQQLDRYVQALRTRHHDQLNLHDAPVRPWIGVVTDGHIWHAWRYPHDGGDTAEVECNFVADQPSSLIRWLRGIVAAGRPWPPDNLADMLRPRLDEWLDFYHGLTGDANAHASTKLELWADMMRVAGMLPDNAGAQHRLFVRHSFLVTVARTVIWQLNHRHDWDPANQQDIIGDGFVAWIGSRGKGRELAQDLIRRIGRWDWHGPEGDILRDLYTNLIDPVDRHDFGEVYTPDWLAELIVETVLDDEWRDTVVRQILRSDGPVEGRGVLDPACGSGTFLWHAARRILASPLLSHQPVGVRANVAAWLVHGLDINPVAVEIARATLLRALPAMPTDGQSALRIWLGDALNVGRQMEGLFRPQRDCTEIRSPGGQVLTLPRHFTERADFAERLQTLVQTAVDGNPFEYMAWNPDDEDHDGVRDLHQALTDVIRREGNSVWSWYIGNVTGPDRLRRRRVDRIVANPPWVQMSTIRDTDRKNVLRALAQSETMAVWPGGRYASSFDMAQLFVLRCRADYLHDPVHDPAGWLVKISALTAGHWERFRVRHEATISGHGGAIQKVDLSTLKPFKGGDANRCCLLLENAALDPEADDLVAARPNRLPGMHEDLQRVRPLLQFDRQEPLLPQAPSAYVDARGKPLFRTGASVTPHILVGVGQRENDVDPDMVRITTWRNPNAKGPWRTVPVQRGRVPRRWCRDLIRSEQALPFVVRPGRQAVIPTGDDDLLLDQPEDHCPFWQELDNRWQDHHARSLVDNIDHHGKLSSQLPVAAHDERRMVLAPISGHIMRGVRIRPQLIDSTLCHFTAASADEAAFLVALLNAQGLQRAFRDACASGRDFALHPWRKVPLPRFDARNANHRELVGLTARAESAAAQVLAAQEDPERRGQKFLSARIRAGLHEEGIMADIDNYVAAILPQQCVRAAAVEDNARPTGS